LLSLPEKNPKNPKTENITPFRERKEEEKR
jgi:hypothetical protein